VTTTIITKDDYLEKFLEALIARTPSDIQNEAGFDLTKGSPIRADGEGLSIVVAVADQTNETEVKLRARDTLFILAGVETIPASRSSGDLSITSTQSTTIPAGEAVYSLELGTRVGEVVEDVDFVNVETKNVTMISDAAGSDVIFNAGTLYILADFQAGTNPVIINNGTDEESDYDRSKRIRAALLAKTSGTIQALTNAAENTVLTDSETGAVIESVVNVQIGFPWKHLDPQTIPPTQLGEIVLSIQSSLGVPSQDLLDAIELELVGTDELDPQGRQGAGQNVLTQGVGTEDVAYVVDYVPTKVLSGPEEDAIELDIQGKITAYTKSLIQGQPIVPTNWQAAISGDNLPEFVAYYDEGTLEPSTVQEIAETNIWSITSITVTKLPIP
jgi:hypothetical protein